MKSASLVAMAALLFSAEPIHSQQISGNELLEACQGTDGIYQGFCVGYIIGTIEGQRWGSFVTMDQIAPEPDTEKSNARVDLFIGHCTPENVTNQQLRDLVVKALVASPETRHESARTLVWEALTDAFPCSR